MSQRKEVDLDAVLADRKEIQACLDDDVAIREIEAETELLLRPGNEELLRGIRPELLKRLSAYTARDVKPKLEPLFGRRMLFAGLAIAASIALAFVVLDSDRTGIVRHTALAPTGEMAPVFAGTVKEVRGAAPGNTSRTYPENGTLRIELFQAKQELVSATLFRVFEVDADARIRMLPMRVARTEDGQGVSFVAEGLVADLFQSVVSAHSLLIVVAGFSMDPSELSGLPAEQVKARRDVRVFSETIQVVR